MFPKPLRPFVTKSIVKIPALMLFFGLIAGCAITQSAKQIDQLESVKENPRVILMPPDIRYYLLTAGGIFEPHAEWTEVAQTNFTAAIEDFAVSIDTDLTIVDRDNLGETHIQYEKLHSVVGLTILQHQFGMFKLPSKGNGQIFDWSLGSEISALADEHDADYGLFVYYRDIRPAVEEWRLPFSPQQRASAWQQVQSTDLHHLWTSERAILSGLTSSTLAQGSCGMKQVQPQRSMNYSAIFQPTRAQAKASDTSYILYLLLGG